MRSILVERPNETGISKILIREANIKLASLKDPIKYSVYYSAYSDCLTVARAIDDTIPQSEQDVDFILETINDIWKKGILTPLTLDNDEFERVKEGVKENIRYRDIKIFGTAMVNCNAFNLIVNKLYDYQNKKELEITPYIVEKNQLVLLTKGGVTTGESFKDCIICPETISKHEFIIQNIVNIPVSAIKTDVGIIYTMDAREPKFKVLKDFYDVRILTNNAFKGLYDIRKFKKLTK